MDRRTSSDPRLAMVRLAIFTVNAGAEAMVSAMAMVTESSSSSSATRRLTIPCPKASSAVITRPVSAMSVATPCPAIWNSRAVPPESGITPWTTSGSIMRVPTAATRMSHRRARSNAPPMTQPFRAQMIGQGMVRHLGRSVTTLDEFEVRDVLDPDADLAGVPTRGERPPLAPPDDGPELGHLVDLGQHLPQAPVHLVAHGVVLGRTVVGDDGQGPVHLEADEVPLGIGQGRSGVGGTGHSWVGHVVGSSAGALAAGWVTGSPNGPRPSCSRMGVKGGCTVWRRCQLAPSTTSECPLM